MKNIHPVAAVAGLLSPYFCGFDKQPCPLLNKIQFLVPPFYKKAKKSARMHLECENYPGSRKHCFFGLADFCNLGWE